MLSIGKMTAGREAYYTSQLPGGRDEYYTRGENEAPAVWLGSAADRLGLDGPVDAEQFRRLLDAAHPVTGNPLGVPRTTDKRLAGYDLTFSAPKSVSVLWALAPADVATQVAAAHDRAVAHAVEVLESEVIRAGRGAHGVNQIETDGVVAAGFGHRTSRAGDPQMHTHVVIPNLTVDHHGRWSAVAGARIYGWAKTVGYLYQSSLRAELSESLGVRWGAVTKGAAEIEGVPPALLDAFSTRRAEVVAAIEASGANTRAGREIAALSTRQAKDHDVEIAELRHGWHRTATEIGVDVDFDSIAPGPSDVVDDHSDVLAEELLAPTGLCQNATTFDRRDVLQALAAGHAAGLRPGPARQAADRFQHRPEVVALRAATRAGGPLYSTADLIAVENDLVERSARPRPQPAGRVRADVVEAAIAGRPSLSEEQKHMVRSLTGSGAGVEVVVGRAGSGKTYALDTARQAWTQAGYQVIGAALAARAAAELQAGAGMASTTVDALLAELDQPSALSKLRGPTVLVVDEAAMVGTRKLARLAAHAERAGAKLVFVGDHRQLPEIEAGGAFAALAARVPVSELAGNRRQAEAWERDALAELRSGSVADAIEAFERGGRLHLADNAETARQHLVDAWWAARQTGQAAMYALRRAEVADLNARARHHMRRAALIGDDVLHAGGRDYALGDEVICLRNYRRVGVANGTRSTISAIDADAGTVTLATGQVLPREYVAEGHLGYGYATTVHKAQGATVDHAFLLGSDAMFREAGYVGLSRARNGNHLYIVAPHRPGDQEPDPLAEVIARLGTSRAQTMAAEQLAPSELPDRSGVPTRLAHLVDPPEWLLDALGPPPVTAEDRDAWAHRAERIAAYRDVYAVTDTRRPLGPRPADADQRRAFDLAQLAIDEQHRTRAIEKGRSR